MTVLLYSTAGSILIANCYVKVNDIIKNYRVAAQPDTKYGGYMYYVFDVNKGDNITIFNQGWGIEGTRGIIGVL